MMVLLKFLKYLKNTTIFIIFLILINNSFLFAKENSLVNIYRSNGIKAVEKQLDLLLTSSTYWQKIISKSITKYGWYETPHYLLLCDGLKKTMEVYYFSNGQLHLLDTFNVVIGKKGIGKNREGDDKTPIGVYKLVSIKKDLNKILYGPIAFVTNYPNKLDISLGRKGDGIWIHGFPANSDKKDSTKGCIALSNDKLLKLASEIDYKKTFLIIKDGVKIVSNKDNILKILTFIYKWRYFWKYNKINKYLSLYTKDAVTLIGSFEKFKKHKLRIFRKKQYKEIIFKNISITPYPNKLNKRIWRVSLFENYKTCYYNFKGEKLIYIIEKQGKLKIWREF